MVFPSRLPVLGRSNRAVVFQDGGHQNRLYAQLHYFLNFSQLLVSCLPLLAKLINSGAPDLSSQETRSWLKFRK